MGALQFLVGLLVLVAVMIFGGVWAFQKFGIYRFPSEPVTPAEVGLDTVRVASLASEDETELRAWIIDPKEDRPIILALHGSNASIGSSLKRLAPLSEAGFGIVMMQYRGAEGSAGRPSELGFAADARAIYDGLDELVGHPVPADRRILYGFSLGAGVGSRLASERDFAALVFEAAPLRTCLYYQRRYLEFPFCRLMWAERYDVVDHIQKTTAPKFFVWGSEDEVLPVEWSRALFEAAPEPKSFAELQGGHHADLVDFGLLPAVEEFLSAHFGKD